MDICEQDAGPHRCLRSCLGACGHAKVSMPGGFMIGSRPIDLHLKGLVKPWELKLLKQLVTWHEAKS